MKQPVLTATLMALTGLLCFVAGNNSGTVNGLRTAASGCNSTGGFKYSGTEYRCRVVYTMTAQEWAKEKTE